MLIVLSWFFFFFIFFFKQKTAYEMRISDWSSDVCSSDLPGSAVRPRRDGRRLADDACTLAGNAGLHRRDPPPARFDGAGRKDELTGAGTTGGRGREAPPLPSVADRRLAAFPWPAACAL